MNAVVRNVLAVLAGVVVGAIVNMALVMAGPSIIPPPPGADVTTMEGLQRSLHLFEPRHFLFPFLAHALGTLAGATVTALLAASRKFELALVIGVVFLAGGVANSFMLPGPTWFNVLDMVGAYIPMAWLGARVATNRVRDAASPTGNEVRPAGV
jgi:hypothetical protein